MELDYDLLSLLPTWYRDILDYQEICQTEESQFEALAGAITAVADNFFFQTMDASAVAQWEQIFGISANPALETLDFRRVRLLNRISTQPPFTLAFLQQKLDELIGPGRWTVTVDYPNYTLYIESSALNQSYATEVAFTINRIKPAHIVYRNNPYVTETILLSEQIDLSDLIFNYRLGAWGLGLQPFASEDPQGVIKMPTTQSIESALLAGVANFVSGDVASARVNGTTVISNLSKSVAGSTLTVTYSVTPEQASEITLLELLDGAGTVLTSSQVYVPVSGNTVLKHTIPVTEGVNASGE